ncbi:methylated-DNA--[protein]-cysteine S-methyltransferase [Plastoroseomonas hellenica]|uniref:methylated-DNA--[protein]-cysteine S-methyltransferase n=1 Tax=Plastoroseomonas hellenica TaxID=2687306 RepID=UPI001BA65E6F|nr:methylated-DNA--[protein]-cysteine S-methyltransferase [Plastoroseomonas hellenica]MBR0645862.1 methylated-DNA--[protein]-cysteine S-methyltransferase [Plastoroseomonas hellenica]
MSEAQQHHRIFGTARGFCGVAWSDLGITAFLLPTKTAEAAERLLLRRAPDAEPGTPPPMVADAIAAARAYFEGEATDFSRFPLDLGAQDALFERIYAAVRMLRWGETTTYGALAKALGAGPEVAREVGQAMARNPVPLIIPCHRVLAAGGRIGGFSAPGGAESKAHMLALEGVRPTEPPGAAQQAFSF